MMKLTYNVSEAAAALGVSESTIWRLIRGGDLIVNRALRRTLITAESLNEWRLRGTGQQIQTAASR